MSATNDAIVTTGLWKRIRKTVAGISAAALVGGLIVVGGFGAQSALAATDAPDVSISAAGTYIAGEDLTITLDFNSAFEANEAPGGDKFNLSAGLVLPEDVTVVNPLMSEHGLRLPVLLLPASDREVLLLALEQRGPSRSRDFLLGLADRMSLVPDAVAMVNLSDRELIVLRALAAGESLAAIAASLFVSKNTVKSQVQSIYRKLGVGTRDEALLTAAELHLLA